MTAWILSLMTFLAPVRSEARRAEYLAIATAEARACGDDQRCAAELTAIAYMESGFVVGARNASSGTLGPWQLAPPAPASLDCQAREALRRLRAQGWDGYTGERGVTCPWTGCPLASRRRLVSAMLVASFGE